MPAPDSQAVQDLFKSHFGFRPAHITRAPAKVELLGSHAEDNEGLALTVRGDFGMGGPVAKVIEVDRRRGHFGAVLGDALEATKESLDRVVLDVTDLAFIGMKGSACLADWLDYLRDARADGLAPTTIRYNESIRWQRVTIPSLQRNDPALRLESRE